MKITERQSIPQGSTRTLRASGATIFDLETGERISLNNPDSITFKVKNLNTDVTTSIVGNQEGSTNNYNADYTFTDVASYKVQAILVKDSVSGVSPIINIIVTESI